MWRRGSINIAIVWGVPLCSQMVLGALALEGNHGAQANFELRFPSTAGRGYVIQASTDLQTWSQVYATNAQSAQVIFPDPMLTARKFYRILEFAQPLTGDQTIRTTANDNFANRAALSGISVSVIGDNTTATIETGEPAHAYFDSGSRTVWWSWTAPADGNVTVNTVGSYFDTLIGIYTGDALANLTAVAKNRYLSKLIAFDATQGKTYQIAVGGNRDTGGEIKLKLALVPPSTGSPPASLAESSIALDETSDPNVPLRHLRISADGKSWAEVENGSINVFASGKVIEYTRLGATATLKLEAVNGNTVTPLDYTFTFTSETSGRYVYLLDNWRTGAGWFTNFRSTRNGFAPPSPARQGIQLTRSTGQSHYYTFTLDLQFHDSDGEEHGSGNYTYTPSGSSALLVLTYVGPAEIKGDQHRVQLKFNSTSDGTFTSEFHRNDGAVLPIDGTFLVEYGN